MTASRWQLALARSLAGAPLLAVVVAWLLGRDNPELDSIWFFVFYSFGVLATSSLGLVLVSRRSHPLGWILLVVALAQILLLLSFVYATYQQPADQLGTLPGARVAAWFSDQLWLVTLALAVLFVPLLFPDGRLPSRRWRPVLWLMIAVTIATWLPIFLEETLFAFPDVAAPLASVALPQGVQDAIFRVGFVLFGVVALGFGIASPVVRWRRGDAVERQQLKWLFAAVGVLLVEQVAVGIFDLDGPIADAAIMVSLLALPAALTAAIMRYRLFDIDRLFRRTLGYVLALGVLAGGYALLVVGLARLVPAAENSNIVVALVTVAAALAARPVHQRIKRGLDRRFNRRGYDAEQVVESLHHLLADQIDADTVVDELVRSISFSLEPSTIAVYVQE